MLPRCLEGAFKIGGGAHGEVYRGTDEQGRSVAMKRIHKPPPKEQGTKGDQGFPATEIREIKLLHMIHHPNVVRLNDVVVDEAEVAPYTIYIPL